MFSTKAKRSCVAGCSTYLTTFLVRDGKKVENHCLNQWLSNFSGLQPLFGDSSTPLSPCLKYYPKSQVKTPPKKKVMTLKMSLIFSFLS